MPPKLDKSWHLAENDAEIQVTEFEFQLWRVFYSFLRWQEDCHRYVCGSDLSGYELALLHIIRMKDRPKTIYEISRLLNRDDPNNIQYGLSKLIKLGLVEKDKADTSEKALSYRITQQGRKSTDDYSLARRNVLIELFKQYDLDSLKLEQVAKTLNSLIGIYDEGSRLAAAYKKSND